MNELKSLNLNNLKTKKEILRFLKEDGCPTNQIKKIDWTSCEYEEDKNLIEFHNPEDLPEYIDLYMMNGDSWTIGVYLDENMNIEYMTKGAFSIID